MILASQRIHGKPDSFFLTMDAKCRGLDRAIQRIKASLLRRRGKKRRLRLSERIERLSTQRDSLAAAAQQLGAVA